MPRVSAQRARRAFKGSLTAEAALVLPLYLMAVITLLCFLAMPGKLSDVSLRQSGKARRLAAAAGAAGGTGEDLWIDLPEILTMSAPFAALPISPVRIMARARVRAWTGEAPGTFSSGGGEGSDTGTVYITDYESVYHTHADCTHLDLSIRVSDTAHVDSLRNAYGKRYKPCSGFPKGYTGPVYLSEKGDCYYPTGDDPGLTRHVHVTTMSQTEGLPLCERCAAHDS